ncbi:hypothetical protein B0T25DRAFT_323332 [Lasiosphaeria hispida]|uniref:Uncharacterized protein n=1 Tax=Lasiosphaeria hispida TaxID=260671 RepID=A0AAJ0H9Q0_9PEZI|nr:hypothetical protein B0T25DRAFT_323332 [Lasiosphaeria hispida]
MKPHQHRDDSANTRRWCVFGLVVSWFAAIGSLLAGAISLYIEIRDGSSPYIVMSHTWREIVPLVMNVLVTLLNDSMGYIHTCTLRWSLQREGKLEFNSNLRLLTASKFSRPNGMIANLVHMIGIVLAYGSTSLIFLSMNPGLARVLGKDYDSSDTTGVHMNAVALLTLGAGFLLQATISNWALVATTIPTWSSNPLDVVRACCLDEHSGHRVEPRIGRCMMGVHLAKEDARALRPVPKQRPMITAHSRIRWILFLLWLLPILSGIWGGGLQAYIMKGHQNAVFGRSWSLLPTFTGKTDSNCSTRQCTDGTSVVNLGWSTSNGAVGTTGGVFLITAFQSVVTLSLHCAELIVNLSRDEKIYRELIGPKGTNGRYNSVTAAMSSWQTLFLFALKAGVHWMFGLAISLQFHLGVNMHAPQVFYLAGFTLVTAVFGMSLSLGRAKGLLPPSYGHLQTIADIVDEWSDSGCMFWGEKRRGNPGYTGTGTDRLDPPKENMFYGGHLHHPAHLRNSMRARVVSGGVPTELDRVGPVPSPLMGYPPPAPLPAPPPYGQHPYSQWAQMQNQHRPSQNSLNSAYSGYSGYSGYSNHSYDPFLPRNGGY